MMLKLSKVLKILIFFIYVSNGARKVRYSRLKSRKSSSGGSPGDPSDVYEFLNRITPPRNVMFELLKEKYQDYVATTTTSTTTTTTTTTPFTTPSTPVQIGPRKGDRCTSSSGLLPVSDDCTKYLQCQWGRFIERPCGPGTHFNARLKICDWPKNAKCKPKSSTVIFPTESPSEGILHSVQSSTRQVIEVVPSTDFNKPNCKAFKHLGYTCVPSHQCINGKVDKTAPRSRSGYRAVSFSPPRSSSIFQPWTKKCFGWKKTCCKDPNFQTLPAKPAQLNTKPMSTMLCPSGFTGLKSYPFDCSKFVNCWKGSSTIQSCGPGTHFNARHSVCDWPAKANCELVVQSPNTINAIPDLDNDDDDDDDIDDAEDDGQDIEAQLWEQILGKNPKPINSETNLDAQLWDLILSNNDAKSTTTNPPLETSTSSSRDLDSQLWDFVLDDVPKDNSYGKPQTNQNTPSPDDLELWGISSPNHNNNKRPQTNQNQPSSDDLELWGISSYNNQKGQSPPTTQRSSYADVWDTVLSNNDQTNDQDQDQNWDGVDVGLWEAALTTSSRSSRSNKVYPAPRSGQKVRLRNGKAPFSGKFTVFS